MSPTLTACIYVLAAIVAARVLCGLVFPNKKRVINKATMGWTLLTLMLFLSPSVEIYFVGAGLILLLLAPRPIEERLQFYFALLPVIPVYIKWRVSIPGVETLLILDHMKLLAIVLLIPIYIYRPRRKMTNFNASEVNNRSRNRKLFMLFFVYLMAGMILDLRDGNLTSSIRGILSRSLDPLILVLVVFVICQSRETVDKLLFGILISGILLACISCVEAFTRWQLYNTIDASFSVGGISVGRQGVDYRGGILRTPVTMAPIPFGIFMSMCLVINYYFLGLKKLGDIQYGSSKIVAAILLAGLLFSGSRGAWIMAVLMLGLMIITRKQYRAVRPVAYIGAVASLFSLPSIIQYLTANDPYGTFQYRIDLFYNSLDAIGDSFFLGAKNFRDHPAMLESMQGQGIVDVVNAYIAIGLGYGVPMLALIVIIILSVIRKLSKLRRQMEDLGELKLLEWQIRTLLAIIVGGFVMVISVSLVDRVSHYLWVSLVLGMSALRYADWEISATKKQTYSRGQTNSS